MIAGDRVRFMGIAAGATLGTVDYAGGYYRVRWDDGTSGRFSPALASTLLELVTGDDALPRHVWRDGGDVWTCATCGVEQTDENDREACKPAAPAEAGS